MVHGRIWGRKILRARIPEGLLSAVTPRNGGINKIGTMVMMIGILIRRKQLFRGFHC